MRRQNDATPARRVRRLRAAVISGAAAPLQNRYAAYVERAAMTQTSQTNLRLMRAQKHGVIKMRQRPVPKRDERAARYFI